MPVYVREKDGSDIFDHFFGYIGNSGRRTRGWFFTYPSKDSTKIGTKENMEEIIDSIDEEPYYIYSNSPAKVMSKSIARKALRRFLKAKRRGEQ